MICEVLASLELAAQANPNLRLITWHEILARAPETTQASPIPFRIPLPSGLYLIPDGLFGIEYRTSEKEAYRFFALEADRGTMPVVRSTADQTSYLGKIAAYREIIVHGVHRGHLGIPNLLVLTVTISQPRMSEITECLEQADENAAFLFKVVGGTDLIRPAEGLWAEPWARAGLPPLQIDRRSD